MLDLPSPLAVVCHDAGAANLIIAWLAVEAREDVRPVMEGPARALWRNRFGSGRRLWPLEAALEGAAALLSGTGWASDLEHRARIVAARAGIVSAAVIDHWVNYAERFVRGGEAVWPDEFWVVDEEAFALAARIFPPDRIRLRENLYLEEIVARIPARPPDPAILYVLEPMRSDWGRGEPGEFQALDYFMARRDRLGVSPGVPLRLRPHPSDPPGKYDRWIARQCDVDVALDGSSGLAEAIGAAPVVVGCQSFALVVALAAERFAVSTLPPWAPPCALPHEGICHLKTLKSRCKPGIVAPR